MQINLIIEEIETTDLNNMDKSIYNIYLAHELLKTCNSSEEVGAFLKQFEETHSEDSVILRFS